MSKKQIILWGFFGLVLLSMLGGAIAVLFPTWRSSDEVLQSIALTGFYALWVMALVIFGKRMPITRLLSLIGVLVSLIFFLIIIWFERPLDRFWESVVISTGWISIAIAGGLMHRVFVYPIKPRGLGGSMLKWSAMVFAAIVTGMIVYGFVTRGTNYWRPAYFRTMWVMVILGAGTTIATAALAIFGPKPGDDEPGLLASSMPVSMTCPRCNATMVAHSNRESRCPACRLKVRVEIEEPRCSCGYLLYQLESDTCPECGKHIADEDRWQGKPCMG